MAGGWMVRPQWSNPISLAAVTSGGTGGGTLTSGAAANTKGGWTQVVAATTGDAQWVVLQVLKPYGTSPNSYGIDIGIGAAGSEVALVSNLTLAGGTQPLVAYQLPLTIPAGSRIALRSQNNTASAPCYYTMQTFADSAFGGVSGSAIDTFGFNASVTLGTALDPGATANTKGAWAQLVASTPAAIAGIVASFDTQGRTTGTSNIDYLFDIAIGASGSERIILPNYYNFMTGAGLATLITVSDLMPLAIPAGSRIAARCQSGNTTADRTVGLTLYGVRL